MKISYDDRDDILLIEFSQEKVVRDVSHGWNVNVGYGEHGIAEISILDAKKAGFWPIENSKELVSAAA